MNIKKDKKKTLKKNVFGNDYPDPLKLTGPNHDDDIGKDITFLLLDLLLFVCIFDMYIPCSFGTNLL